jgi:hypothetical protein
MKRFAVLILACIAFLLLVTPREPAATPPESLAGLMPSGALLYLEAKDFKSLLNDWNDSTEKQLWLKSDNYQVFSRSRLFIRLQEAQSEFATAAGFPPDMAFTDSVAGGRSALGLYDVGRLQFLYITRMPSASVMESVLWKAREKFEPRKAGGIAYFIHAEPAHHREVAFTTAGEYLFIATREDLLARALELYSGKTGPDLSHEKWFEDAVHASEAPGDLRLALNMQSLVRSPHFQSYWIQRNVSEFKQYEAEIADVHRSPSEIREDRVLLREPAEPPAAEASGQKSLGEILRFVPGDAGIYRAWENPTAAQALDLVEQKILSPHSGGAPASQLAPQVVLGNGAVGGEGDFETQIDVAPPATSGGTLETAALKKLFQAFPPTAALQVESTRNAADGVLVGTESAVVLSAATDWDGSAVRAALQSAIEPLWTTSGLGVQWTQHEESGKSYFELNGLDHLCVAADGRFLIIATRPQVLLSVLSRSSSPAVSVAGTYAAGFRHAQERDQLVKMLGFIETPAATRLAAFSRPGGHTPLFFSENLGSLSGALASVKSESIVVNDMGPRVTQAVRYELGP